MRSGRYDSTPTIPIAKPEPVSASTRIGIAVLLIASPNELIPSPAQHEQEARGSAKRRLGRGVGVWRKAVWAALSRASKPGHQKRLEGTRDCPNWSARGAVLGAFAAEALRGAGFGGQCPARPTPWGRRGPGTGSSIGGLAREQRVKTAGPGRSRPRAPRSPTPSTCTALEAASLASSHASPRSRYIAMAWR